MYLLSKLCILRILRITMELQIIEVKSNKKVDAEINEALSKEMPTKKSGWQFSWKSLFKTEGATFYKLTLKDDLDKIQGILMLSIMYEEMLYMNNIEIAPHNIGSKGKFDNVAGSLIAYGCLKSFELGKNTYKGYLTFESKTKLIPLYEKKYGAARTMGQRMFIDPEHGLKLIDKFLKS